MSNVKFKDGVRITFALWSGTKIAAPRTALISGRAGTCIMKLVANLKLHRAKKNKWSDRLEFYLFFRRLGERFGQQRNHVVRSSESNWCVLLGSWSSFAAVVDIQVQGHRRWGPTSAVASGMPQRLATRRCSSQVCKFKKNTPSDSLFQINIRSLRTLLLHSPAFRLSAYIWLLPLDPFLYSPPSSFAWHTTFSLLLFRTYRVTLRKKLLYKPHAS